jgi:hypothetical protein
MRFLYLISLIVLLTSCSSDSQKLSKAKTIKKGMTANNVRAILGAPNDTLKGYFDSSKIMYRYNLSIFSSEDIEIYIDTSNRSVVNIVLPKGESR